MMNCGELRKDIDSLKSSHATMQNYYNRMNNELSGKAEFQKEQSKTEQLNDEILEKYLPDFIEKNPELFEWRLCQEYKIDNPIDSLEYCDDGSILVGGEDGSIKKVSKKIRENLMMNY